MELEVNSNRQCSYYNDTGLLYKIDNKGYFHSIDTVRT